MNTIFDALTLKSVNVSPHRKRLFYFTLIVLLLFAGLQILQEPPQLSTPLVSKILTLSILVLAANIIFNVARILIVSQHRSRRGIPTSKKDNFTVAMNALVNAATVSSLFVFFLWVFQIEFKEFLNTIAIFAVALVLIFQDYIKNFLFGLSMMFSNDYEIGDYIQVGEMPRGVIITLTFSSVHMKTESGDVLYIPNMIMRTHQIVNFSKLKPQQMSIGFTLLREQVTSIASLEADLYVHLEETLKLGFKKEGSHLKVKHTNKDEIEFSYEISSGRSSLKLKDLVAQEIKRFAVEYKS